MRTSVVFLLVGVATAVAAFLAFGREHPHFGLAALPAVTASPAPTSVVNPVDKYFGVAIPLDRMKSFCALTGRKPDLYEEYTGFGSSFTPPPAGMLPLVDLESDASPQAILGGHYDTYLRSFARSVAAYRKPVAISFDPEMNGPWYSYGTRQISHTEFRAIYRYVHNIVASEGARNVIWTWTITRGIAHLPLLKELYPGDAYVNWIGVDGYFNGPSSNFTAVFVHAFHDLRTFTSRPFLITETGVRPGPSAASWVNELFVGVKSRPDVLGFIWFDYNKRADWRLEDDPAALAAFRREAKAYK